ncbi:MAG: hypothetical protein EXR87_04485 [Gammaproteobacteria bacterium]|nr:hypothetical protein [Gammaproteobacteria bacterium]
MTSEAGQSPPDTEAALELRDGYLYARLVPGFEITPERMNRLWKQLGEACEKHQVRHVLTEGAVSGRRMTTMDSCENAAAAARLAPGLAMACFVQWHVPDQQTDFFKIAAMSHGVRVDFFAKLEEALRWLGIRPTAT